MALELGEPKETDTHREPDENEKNRDSPKPRSSEERVGFDLRLLLCI